MRPQHQQIRNIAIIAHVDHGKTTLVDQLLRQSGTFRENEEGRRARDGQQRPRARARHHHPGQELRGRLEGHAHQHRRHPGHADFGGEVERVLSMVDGVLLLVDAVEGPMPQTRFVTKKALALGLKPIVVVNKVDRPARARDWVINAAFDLFDKLGATEEQLDFPVVYASGLNGWASTLRARRASRHRHGAAVRRPSCSTCRPHEGDAAAPLQLQISLARLLQLRRPHRHRPYRIRAPSPGHGRRCGRPGRQPRIGRVNQVLTFEGPERGAGRPRPARATSC